MLCLSRREPTCAILCQATEGTRANYGPSRGFHHPGVWPSSLSGWRTASCPQVKSGRADLAGWHLQGSRYRAIEHREPRDSDIWPLKQDIFAREVLQRSAWAMSSPEDKDITAALCEKEPYLSSPPFSLAEPEQNGKIAGFLGPAGPDPSTIPN